MSKHANISLDVSDEIPDFEREIYLGMILEDMKREAENAPRLG